MKYSEEWRSKICKEDEEEEEENNILIQPSALDPLGNGILGTLSSRTGPSTLTLTTEDKDCFGEV